VVYTPPERPFFCVENQSCSTDAHNLYSQGLQEAAHLTILDPGDSLAAWIEIAVSAQ
jgi:aldose 1-epimerase